MAKLYSVASARTDLRSRVIPSPVSLRYDSFIVHRRMNSRAGWDEELGPDLEKRSMKLENLIPEELSIKANESLVYAIYRNLLENSIRYAGEGSVVRMGGELSADGYAHLYFEDNGVGVDPRHLERIFERFYRVFDPKGGQAEGSGLGLSIVRNAVAFHGGSIRASSEKGHGLRRHADAEHARNVERPDCRRKIPAENR